MIRYIFLSFILLSLCLNNYAAAKWNNSEGGKGKSDPKTYWNKTKDAKSCKGREFEHFNDKITIKTIKFKNKKKMELHYKKLIKKHK